MGPLRPMRRLLALVLLFGIPAAAVPAVYRVGAVLPLTGPDAPAMVDVPRALRVWEAGINALNSGRGVNVTTLSGAILYFQVELFILDDESDEAVHMNKTSRLLDEERVQFMLGGHYRFALRQRELTQAAGIATFHCCVEARGIFTTDISGLLLGIAPPNTRFMDSLLQPLVDRGVKSVGVLYSQADPFTVSSCTSAMAAMQQLGIVATTVTPYDSVLDPLERLHHWNWSSGLGAITDPTANILAQSRGAALDTRAISTAVTSIANARPDALLLCSYSADAAFILQQLAKKSQYVNLVMAYPAGSYYSDHFQSIAGSVAAYTLGSSLWRAGVSFPDPFLGSTTAFAAAYANMSSVYLEAGVNITTTPLGERGVAAAAAGTALIAALQNALTGCNQPHGTDSDSVLFSAAALVCTDQVNGGYLRTLNAARALGISTVFGRVAFDRWQQVYSDRYFTQASLTTAVVLPAAAAKSGDALVYPAPGTVYIDVFGGFGEALLAICLVCVLTLLFMFCVLCCNVNHRAIKKSRWAYSALILAGAVGLCLYPFFYLGVPTGFTCNMRNWFVNGGVALLLSGTAAKAYAQTQQQNYPLQAKKHKLTSFKVLKWTVVVGAVEAGVQFCSLLFARVEPVRAFCVLDHSAFGILLLYAPFVIKAAVLLVCAVYSFKSRQSETYMNESKFVVFMVFNAVVVFLVSVVLASAVRLQFVSMTEETVVVTETALALYAAMSTVLIIILPKCLHTATDRNLTKAQALKEAVDKTKLEEEVAGAGGEEEAAEAEEDGDGDALGDLPGGMGRKASVLRKSSVGGDRKLSMAGASRKLSSALSSKRDSKASILSSEDGGTFSISENQRVSHKKVAQMQAEVDRLTRTNAMMKTNMELMKLATQEQLTHGMDILKKYRDVPTVAPPALPLPSAVVTTDLKTEKLDAMVPVVVRKDSIPLESAILDANLRAGKAAPQMRGKLIRRFSSKEKPILVKKLAVAMDPNAPTPHPHSRSPSPSRPLVSDFERPPLFLKTNSHGVPLGRSRAVATLPASSVPVSSSAIQAARLYLAKLQDQSDNV